MKQHKMDSLFEALTNTAIGFFVSLVTWYFVAAAMNIPVTMSENLIITGVFTVVSICRGYVLRRLFDGRSAWQSLKAAVAR
jgi:hypothetical protein